MTLDELADRMQSGFDKLGTKVDNINTTVAVHTKEIAAHDRENISNREAHKDIDRRLDKIEKTLAFAFGAGGAAGAGIAKLFFM